MKHGPCGSFLPIILLLGCGAAFVLQAHHGCGHWWPSCHSSGSCRTGSSCHSSGSCLTNQSCHSNSCSHHAVCQKCGGAYMVCDTYRNGKLCPRCLEMLRQDRSSREDSANITRACDECGSRYTIPESDDCGLCQNCFEIWCSHQE